MRRLRWFLLSTALLASLQSIAQLSPVRIGPVAGVQPTAVFAPTSEYTFRSNAEEVAIRFSAISVDGRPVKELGPSDIHVIDDDRRVARITTFQHLSRTPLRIGILIDQSDSFRNEQDAQMKAVADSLPTMIDSKQDSAFVIGFSNRATLFQDATASVEALRDALLRMPHRQGLTSLFDSVAAACDEYFANASDEDERIILLFSDGNDTLSVAGVEDAVRAALRHRVRIHAITSPFIDAPGRSALQALTERTGGRIYPVSLKRGRKEIAAAMRGITRDEYSVTFRPATPRSGYHEVKVEVPGDTSVRVSPVEGYFLGSR